MTVQLDLATNGRSATLRKSPAVGTDPGSPTPVPDEALLEQIARRDLDALDLFYDRHGRVAFSVAYSVLGSVESAEDVVQEAFLSIWRRAETYTASRGTARSWLLSVVRHRAIDVVRSRAARPHGPRLDDVSALLAAEDDPSSEALRRIEAASVRAALEGLSSPQRQVIELAFFAGLTYPEIAERVNVPLGTVKSRIRLALDRLRTALMTVHSVRTSAAS